MALTDPALAEARNRLFANAAELLSHTRIDQETWNAEQLHQWREDFERDYQSLKMQLLRAGTSGALRPRPMATLLEQLSALHRLADQSTKSALYLERVISQHQGPAPATEPEPVDEVPRPTDGTQTIEPPDQTADRQG